MQLESVISACLLDKSSYPFGVNVSLSQNISVSPEFFNFYLHVPIEVVSVNIQSLFDKWSCEFESFCFLKYKSSFYFDGMVLDDTVYEPVYWRVDQIAFFASLLNVWVGRWSESFWNWVLMDLDGRCETDKEQNIFHYFIINIL